MGDECIKLTTDMKIYEGYQIKRHYLKKNYFINSLIAISQKLSPKTSLYLTQWRIVFKHLDVTLQTQIFLGEGVYILRYTPNNLFVSYNKDFHFQKKNFHSKKREWGLFWDTQYYVWIVLSLTILIKI